MKYVIYKATCANNGKNYIGLTKSGILRRSKEHEWDALSGKYDIKFHHALRKHGIEAFKWEELCECPTRENAEFLEKYFIRKLNTYYAGYNSTFGGEGFSGDAKIRKKISNTLKNKYHKKPGTRLKHSRERGGRSIQVFQAILVQPARGFESKRPATYQKGAVVGIYPTQIDCCEKLDLAPSKVNVCLKGRYGRKTHKGYIFEYVELT